MAESATASAQLPYPTTQTVPSPVVLQPQGHLLSKAEVCQELGISLNTLTEWMKDGIVPYLRYGRRVYFERHRLLAAGRFHGSEQRRK